MVKLYLPVPLHVIEALNDLGYEKCLMVISSKVQLEQTAKNQVQWNIFKDRDSTTALGSLFQCWPPLRWKGFFMYSVGISSFCLLLSLHAFACRHLSCSPSVTAQGKPQTPFSCCLPALFPYYASNMAFFI